MDLTLRLKEIFFNMEYSKSKSIILLAFKLNYLFFVDKIKSQ
jgi:hypothetical protein